MSKKKPPANKEISEDPVLTDKASTDPVPADKAPVKSDEVGSGGDKPIEAKVEHKSESETKAKSDTKPADIATKPDAKPADTEAKADKKPADVVTKPDTKLADTKHKAEIKPAAKPPTKTPPAPKAKETPKPGRGFPILGLLNLVLIIGIIAAAAWYWQMQQKLELQRQESLSAFQQQIKQQLSTKADQSTTRQIQQRLQPLESVIGDSANQIGELQDQQQALLESTEKLYELYGRDENGWQLAEVEYLMRVAQHKLILENDFEGAAMTLQAASDKIAATADPGLLPVRVQISDEIAGLKTRARPDLVGMTLLLAQLSKQIRALKPGYEPRIDTTISVIEPEPADPSTLSLEERVMDFINSLVTVSKSETIPTRIETLSIDIEELLENNLKLTRWTVLERDAFQYERLMEQNVNYFKQYYDLDNAANHDFYSQLLQLQKSQIKPEKPNISGSLEMLRHIISRRQLAPGDDMEQEAGDV